MTELFWYWLRLSSRNKMRYSVLAAVLFISAYYKFYYLSLSNRLDNQEAMLNTAFDATNKRLATLAKLPSLAQLMADQQRLLTLVHHDEQIGLAGLIENEQYALQQWQPSAQAEKIVMVLSWVQFQHWYDQLVKSAPASHIQYLSLRKTAEKIHVEVWLDNEKKR